MEKVKLSEKTIRGLKKQGVGIVYFFGSRAQGVNLKYSDYDIGIVYQDLKKLNSSHYYTKPYELITKDIPDKIHGPKLDISYLQNANAALQMTAIKYGQVLLEADSNFRADYEENVIKIYDDYMPLQKQYEEANFAAFK